MALTVNMCGIIKSVVLLLICLHQCIHCILSYNSLKFRRNYAINTVYSLIDSNINYFDDCEWKIENNHINSTLQDFLLSVDSNVFQSQSKTKRVIRRGLVSVNSRVINDPSYLLNREDLFRSVIYKTRISSNYQTMNLDNFTLSRLVIPENAVKVLFEDDYCAVVIKPQGMPIFSDKSNRLTLHSTLLHVLTSPLTPLTNVLRRPQPVHRLDAGTGGLVLCAKTHKSLTILSESFSNRLIDKKYRAIVFGRLDGSGIITSPIEGKSALSHFNCHAVTAIKTAIGHDDIDARYRYITTVDVIISTGRTHQIRRHLDSLGHPIIGDKQHWFKESRPVVKFDESISFYKDRNITVNPCLWAIEMNFTHPLTRDIINLHIPEPQIFESIREYYRNYKI